MAKTIFVLGAGASIPYGFPSGAGLVNQISSALTSLCADGESTRSLSNCLKTAGKFDLESLVEFRDSLYLSRTYSIDAFLQRRKEFRELGKILIRNILLDSEYYSRAKYYTSVRNMDLPDMKEFQANDWYRYFFNEIKDQEDFNFKIYTYNYDRSLEYYLVSAYQHFFSFSLDQAFQRVRAMDIIHLHGSLGRFKAESDFSENCYGLRDNLNDYDRLVKRSNDLEIIYEASQHNIDRLHEDIKIARHVVFIGFGFDKNNMANLRFNEIEFDYKTQKIYASRLGISDNEFQYRLLAKTKLSSDTIIRHGPHRAGDNYYLPDIVFSGSETALEFMRNTLPPSTYVG